MRGDLADISTGDRSFYVLEYGFGKHNGGAAVLVAESIVLLYQDDLTWSTSRVVLDSGNLVARVNGDATHVCRGEVQWVIEYRVYDLI